MKETRCSQSEIELAEEIWLHYFNDVVYKAGLLTDREYAAISNQIDRRKQSPIMPS